MFLQKSGHIVLVSLNSIWVLRDQKSQKSTKKVLLKKIQLKKNSQKSKFTKKNTQTPKSLKKD